ncbi:uncharacterized protein LOC113751836 [Coffea eugenioides]|uniref:uncharacterized protein LOC113751836 n=1 Tax=Coffea eugenioides TaxID=49369 RepID=UPI000F60BDA9|nr:uncharacterized protein LOC113751836 [Coffea eugenioides]
MRLKIAADALRCKAFPMFLKGKARLWFQGLAPGSIRNFTELARQFAAQFVSSKTYSKNAAHLMAVKQKPDESLKNFMTRFNTESLQIRDKDEKVVMAAFMNGLRVEELYYKLVEQPPKNLGELLTRAHAAANAEEACRLKRESDRELGDRRGRGNPSESRDVPAKKNVFDRLSKEKVPAPPPIPEKGYTPLTRPRAQILAVMETEGLGDRPSKMGTPRNKRNQDRYCAFHRNVGHDTEGCWALKKEIEDLVQRGYLGRFVR